MRRFLYTLAAALVALAVPSCNILNDYGNAVCNQNPAWCPPPPMCSDTDGSGGDDGSGGADGNGGDDTGLGGDDTGTGTGTGTDTGIGTGTSTGTGTDIGTATDTGTDPGERYPPRPRLSVDTGLARRAPLHRHRRPRTHRHEAIGQAREADDGDCTPVNVPPPPSAVPNWQGLTTTNLRSIAKANNIHGCANQTGITQSRTIGVTFEAWVLKTMGKLKSRWTKPILSPRRKQQNQGLPASVIPELIDSQTAFQATGMFTFTWEYFPNSLFYEVKAVTGNIAPGTSQYQILGLLDLATFYPTVPPGQHAPPAVVFITTSNSTITPAVTSMAISFNVAVWQYKVEYDANSANQNNPNLRIGAASCLTPQLYPTQSLLLLYWLDPGGPWPINPLTWPTDPEQDSVVVSGDPDPAEVD